MGRQWRHRRQKSIAATFRMDSIPMRRGHWTRPARGDRQGHCSDDGAGRVGARRRRCRHRTRDERSMKQQAGRRGHRLRCVHNAAGDIPAGRSARTVDVDSAREGGTHVWRRSLLHYRHVNQAERWRQMEMQGNGDVFTAAIPAEYTQSPYAMQYSFELRTKSGGSMAGSGIQCDAFESAVLRGDAAEERADGVSDLRAPGECGSKETPPIVLLAGCTCSGAMRYPDLNP